MKLPPSTTLTSVLKIAQPAPCPGSETPQKCFQASRLYGRVLCAHSSVFPWPKHPDIRSFFEPRCCSWGVCCAELPWDSSSCSLIHAMRDGSESPRCLWLTRGCHCPRSNLLLITIQSSAAFLTIMPRTLGERTVKPRTVNPRTIIPGTVKPRTFTPRTASLSTK